MQQPTAPRGRRAKAAGDKRNAPFYKARNFSVFFVFKDVAT